MTFPIVYRENRRGVYRSFDRGKLYDVHATIAFSWHHFSIMDALCCTSSRSKNVYISWVQFNCRLSREASTTKIISHRSRKSNLIFSIFLREASPYNWMKSFELFLLPMFLRSYFYKRWNFRWNTINLSLLVL